VCSSHLKRHRYIFAVRALPPLSVHSLAETVSVQPLPLHSFFDLQALSAPEQEPWPLHSLMPAHFTTSVVFLPALPLAIAAPERNIERSEEHTSELQSLRHLVC